MRARLAEFGSAAVAVIAFSSPAYLAAYQREHLAPVPLLIDEDRGSYRAYGMGRAPWWRAWGLRSWAGTLRLAVRGRRVRRPVDDTLQLGGDVVVGPDGRISYVFRSRDPSRRPPVEELLAAVRTSTRTE